MEKSKPETTETNIKKKKYQVIQDFRLPYQGKIAGGQATLITRKMKTVDLDPNSTYTKYLLSEKDSKGNSQKPYIKE